MPSASRSRSRGRSRSATRYSARSRSPRRSNSPRRASRTPSERHNHNGHRRSRSLSSERKRDNSRDSGRGGRRSYDRRTRSRSQSASVDGQALKSTKIVVEKLTKNVNHGHLEEIFGKYGTIKDIDLPMNRHFNTNRGTAYIVFTDSEGAESAIAHMHEAQLDGAIINVSIVLSRKRFHQSPPPARRHPAPSYMDKPQAPYRDRAPPSGPYGGNSGRYRSPTRRRSPPPSARSFGGRGHLEDRAGDYRRNRSRSRSHSRARSRSFSSRSRSRSRSPPRRRDRRDSRTPPPAREAPTGPGRARRRSPSYSSYGSYSRSRSRDRRDSSRDRYGRRR